MFAREQLKQTILSSGYYSYFNDIDRRVRKYYDLDGFINSCYKGPSKYLSVLDEKLRREVRDIILFDPKFECGNPHTHGRYIFLPYDYMSRFSDLDKLIRHEAIHIWQRYHPCEATQYVVEKYNCPIKGIQNDEKFYRTNPDINRILYGDISNEYKTDAMTLSDIKDIRDHPYELMAYEESLQTI